MSDDTPTTLLEEALEAWRYTRRGLLDEAELIPDDRRDWRPHPDARSAREILRHVLEAGRMAAGELSRDDGDFTRQGFEAHLEEHAGDLPRDLSYGRLRAHLTESLEEGTRAIRAAGELHMLGPIRRFDGAWGTRLAWLQHHVAHESHHRGQLALYVRQLDIVPALTRRIEGG